MSDSNPTDETPIDNLKNSEVIPQKPKRVMNAYNYFFRGEARAREGDFDGATADYDEAIRLNPEHVNAYHNRAIARGKAKDSYGAILDYTEAIRLNPQRVEAYLNRGKLRRVRGYFSGAIADYQTFLDLGGGDQYGIQAEIEKRIRELKKEFGRK